MPKDPPPDSPRIPQDSPSQKKGAPHAPFPLANRLEFITQTRTRSPRCVFRMIAHLSQRLAHQLHFHPRRSRLIWIKLGGIPRIASLLQFELAGWEPVGLFVALNWLLPRLLVLLGLLLHPGHLTLDRFWLWRWLFCRQDGNSAWAANVQRTTLPLLLYLIISNAEEVSEAPKIITTLRKQRLQKLQIVRAEPAKRKVRTQTVNATFS